MSHSRSSFGALLQGQLGVVQAVVLAAPYVVRLASFGKIQRRRELCSGVRLLGNSLRQFLHGRDTVSPELLKHFLFGERHCSSLRSLWCGVISDRVIVSLFWRCGA